MLSSVLICWLMFGVDDEASGVPARPPTQVLIVGMLHLGNPGRDLVNPEIKDVLGERRQKEIRDVIDRLKAFRPTKVALESTPDWPAVKQHLDQYVAGTYALKADERDQIGLRLAKEAKHGRVYGIDFPMDLDFEGLFDYAQKNSQSGLAEKVMSEFESKMKPKLAADYLEKRRSVKFCKRRMPRRPTPSVTAFTWQFCASARIRIIPEPISCPAGIVATSISRPISPDSPRAPVNASSSSLAPATANCYGSSWAKCPASKWLAVLSISSEQMAKVKPGCSWFLQFFCIYCPCQSNAATMRPTAGVIVNP